MTSNLLFTIFTMASVTQVHNICIYKIQRQEIHKKIMVYIIYKWGNKTLDVQKVAYCQENPIFIQISPVLELINQKFIEM